MNKINNILSGFVFKLKDEHRLLRNTRMKICINCEDRDGKFCGICGCLLDAKTRVKDEECPKDLW